MKKELREKIYQIIDSFLTEAKDLNGKERSLERLNQDRHLAVDQFLALFQSEREKIIEEFRKMIGEDERWGRYAPESNRVRNQFRAELRAKLEEMEKGGKMKKKI